MLRAAVRDSVSSFFVRGLIRAYSAADKTVKIWDVYAGKIVRTLVGHTEGLSDLAWSNDSKYLASACDDGTIRIWSVDEVGPTLSCHIIYKWALLIGVGTNT